MKIFRLVAVSALAVAWASLAANLAQAQERAWLQIESYPSEQTARSRAAAYAGEFPNVQVLSGGNWYAIVLGPYAPEEAAGELADLRRAGRVPGDAFVTDGGQFDIAGAEPVAPEAAAPEAAAPEAASAELAAAPTDETLKEARGSEAALSKDERMVLQEALKWYGFYDAKIDGSFGAGTRKSMAAWQEAGGFEPTGVLTSRQRATLVANHAADLAEFGFETVNEVEAGIEITLPLSLVAFDHYEPPFAHFAEKNGSGLRIMLISEPGGVEALAGLYDILQTLEVVPETGRREREERSFSIEAASADVQSYAYAETRDGMVKGYLVVWNPADADRMRRILPVLKSSFRAVGDKALDPGLVPMDDATRAGMLAGLEMRKPKSVASGVFVDDTGHVATSLANVATCAKVTLGLETVAEVVAQDDTAGIALLQAKSPMAPLAVAQLARATPLAGAEISVAGYSYGTRQPAPVLTFGNVDAAEGLSGEPGFLRITAPLIAGDMGGPVLDAAGNMLGLATTAPQGSARQLPPGMALVAGSEAVAALMQGAGIGGATGGATGGANGADTPALSPDALNAAAFGMTVQVACWED